MTPEERKIRNLEKKVDSLKFEISQIQDKNETLTRELHQERRWRVTFQHLMKEVVHEDTVSEDII